MIGGQQEIKRADDYYSDVVKLKKIGLRSGVKIGGAHSVINNYYTVKEGCTTYIIGIPGHGKSTFARELLIRLSDTHKWKHFYWSPEEGNKTRQIADLMGMVYKKPFNELGNDFDRAFSFVNHHFYFPKLTKDCNVNGFFESAQECIDKHKVNSILLDPWNELMHDFQPFNGREDVYLSFTLGGIREFAERNNVHVFIIVHPRTMYDKKKDGKYDPPSFYQISGGAQWANKAQSIICVYRSDFQSGESHILFQKIKPREIGVKGEVIAEFNTHTLRYGKFRENQDDAELTF